MKTVKKDVKNAKEASGLVLEKDKERIDKLTAEEVKTEKEYKEKTKQLDKKIIQVQQSTKTSIPVLQRYHEKMRMRYEWYYKWHLWPYSRTAHFLILGVYLLALTLFGAHFFSAPKPVLAAGNNCVSAVSGPWSEAATWGDSCNNDVPQDGDNVTIANGTTVTLDGNTNDLKDITIDSGSALNADTFTIFVAGNWTNNGNFVYGNSTVVFDGAGDQTIAGTGNLDFWSINVAKSDPINHPVILGANITITADNTATASPLIFTSDGTIDLDIFTLTFTNNTEQTIFTSTASTSVTYFTSTDSKGKIIFLGNSAIFSESAPGTFNFGNIQIGDATHTAIMYIADAGWGGSTFGFGDVNIANATAAFSSGDSPMNVSGNWSNIGTFTAGTGTVTITGSGTSTISGATTFNNFNCVTPGKTIAFQKQTAGAPIFTFAGTFTLTGTSGSKINLQSDTAGIKWLPHFNNATTTVTYTNVKDSGGDAGTATVTNLATDSNVSGNNTSVWLFNQPPNDPADLSQKKTDGTVIANGGWTNENSVKYTATVTDPDGNQVKLCVEKKPTGTPFTSIKDDSNCSVLVNSGSTAEVTIPGQVNNTQYHWHAYAQDSNGADSVDWVDYGTDPAYGIYLTTSYTLTASTPQATGAGWSETVTAKDSGGATVTTANNAINMTSSSGTVVFYTNNSYNIPTTSYTLVNGVVTIYLKDTDAATENITYTATDSAPHSATGTSAGISVVHTPPASAITTPATGTTVGVGTVQVLGTAEDTFGGNVAKVEVRVNSGAWHEATNSGINFSTWAYDASLTSSGDYIIQSRATDSFGAVEIPSDGITLHVSSGIPTVQITKPAQNEWVVQDSYDATGTTTAASGTTITKVEVTIDGTNWVDATNTGTGFSTWKYTISDVVDGRLVLQARATDSGGAVSALYTTAFGIDTVVPTKPGNFSAFNVSNHIAGTTQALLWWQASTDATSGLKEYQIFRGSDQVGTTANNYFVDNNPVSGQYLVKAIDNAGNTISSDEASLDLAFNSVKMAISDVKATPSMLLDGNGKTSAVISWKTDQPSTSLVYYGLGGAKALQAGIDNQLNFSHSVVLTNLDPNTIYHFAVKSKDIYGNTETSNDQIFSSVNNAASDTVWNKVIQVFCRSFEWVRKAMASPILERLGMIQTPEQISPQMIFFNVSVPAANSYQAFISHSGDSGFGLERSTNGQDFTSIAKVTDTNVNAYYFDQNLAAETTYYYRADGVTGMISFRTSGTDTAPPVISNLATKNLGQDKKQTEVVISFTTDKLSTTEVSINDKTYQDDSLNQTHMVLIDNLKAGQGYEYSVKSVDINGMAATGSGSVSGRETSTSKSSFSAITSVVQNKFSQFAGWMRK